MLRNSEFTVPNAYQYNQSRTWRWILSHVLRYWHFALIALVSYVVGWIVFAQARVVIGQAVEVMLSPDSGALLNIALLVFILLATDGICMLLGALMAENVAVRFETDARQELYISLLGKSKTFHDRQRVGDIMARATDDTQQLSNMIVPGSTLLLEVILGFIVPIAFIASINAELVIVPIFFVVAYIVAVRVYLRKLNPAVKGQREHYGKMNAGLEETIS
ncbi:MAG: ABC transporter ATP-binding protein, partial [Chloroflexota bacterium]